MMSFEVVRSSWWMKYLDLWGKHHTWRQQSAHSHKWSSRPYRWSRKLRHWRTWCWRWVGRQKYRRLGVLRDAIVSDCNANGSSDSIFHGKDRQIILSHNQDIKEVVVLECQAVLYIPLFSSSFFVLRLKFFHQDARSRFVGAAGGAGSCAWLFAVKFWIGAWAASGWGVPVVIVD